MAEEWRWSCCWGAALLLNIITATLTVRIKLISTEEFVSEPSYISVAASQIFSLKTRQSDTMLQIHPLCYLDRQFCASQFRQADASWPEDCGPVWSWFVWDSLSSAELLPQNYPYLTTVYKAGGFLCLSLPLSLSVCICWLPGCTLEYGSRRTYWSDCTGEHHHQGTADWTLSSHNDSLYNETFYNS